MYQWTYWSDIFTIRLFVKAYKSETNRIQFVEYNSRNMFKYNLKRVSRFFLIFLNKCIVCFYLFVKFHITILKTQNIFRITF